MELRSLVGVHQHVPAANRALPILILILSHTSCTRDRDVRAEILSDLGQNKPALHISVLTSLPDRELPQLEAHFAERAPHHPWLFGHLLARYATARVLASVRSIYAADHLKWDCDSRFAFEAYFLRVSPAEGEAVLRTAMQERLNNGCSHFRLLMTSRIFASPELESVSIQALNDVDPQVVANAADTLAAIGSVAAEAHIWRRLELWTSQWRDRSDELYRKRTLSDDRYSYYLYEGLIDDHLQSALMNAQAWYFDQPRRQRLLALCFTEGCRLRFASPKWKPPAIRVRVLKQMYQAPWIEVAHYRPGTIERYREKIAQFPAGTVFGWCTDRETGGELSQEQSRIFRDQLGDAAEAQGFRFLTSPPTGTCSGERIANE